MHPEIGRPLRGKALERLCAFLHRCGLDYDAHIDFTVVLTEDDEIVATGSLDGSTLKCIAVAPEHQGEDLSARIVTELRREAFERGFDHLMLYTKPRNQPMFQELGFHPLVRTQDCLLMENRRSGLDDFLKKVKNPEASGRIGCIVANCNPFTRGHRHLIEIAAKECDFVYLFILSEDGGRFSPEARLNLARQCCADIGNVSVNGTDAYMVSAATFPSYFIKDKARVGEIRCALDVRLFGERIAPGLSITHRYVGSEPLCPVTAQYNRALLEQLPTFGISCVEVERLEVESQPVSASRVRALLDDGRLEEIRPLVPEMTYRLLEQTRLI